MRWICLSAISVAFLGHTVAVEGADIKKCVVVPAELADLSPQEPGMVRELKVACGQQVAKGDLLLQLDDSKVQQDLHVAQRKLEAANTKFKAAEINVEYAAAAKKVADADLEISKGANKEVGRSIPLTKIHEQELKCTETELAIKKANSDQSLAQDEAKVAAAEVDAAQVMVARHKILSPIAGEVVDIKTHLGETVQPTQQVIRVVNLDSLWVEGHVSATDYTRAELDGQDVTITNPPHTERVSPRYTDRLSPPSTDKVSPPHTDKVLLPGKVIFVSPISDSGNKYLVRAKVENRKVNGSWLLYPGMFAEMSIQVGKSPLTSR